MGEVFEGYSLAGTYINTFVAANGCDSIRTLNLTVNPLPNPYLGKDTAICPPEKIIASPGIFDSYLWQDGSTQNTYVITVPGTYSVTVSNSCGVKTDNIIVADKGCYYYFPNVFSPNSDNKNDYFKILSTAGISDFHLMIYDRWGEKVFETNDIYKGWDGMYKNHPATVGNYVWYSTFQKDGRKTGISGNVILLR